MPTPNGAPPTGGDDAAVYRRLYTEVADAECLALGERTVAALREELLGPLGPEISDEPAGRERLRQRTDAWARQEERRYRLLLDQAQGDDARLALARRAVLGCAPLCLRFGAWLQWMSSPADADAPAVLAVLALYAADVGVGRPRQSRGDAYLAAMRRLDLADYATPVERLAVEGIVVHGAFRLPAVMIAMGRRPDAFGPELLGADDCLRVIHLPPALRLVREVLPDLADWTALDPSSGRLGDAATDRPAPPPPARLGADEERRAATGFRWALSALRSWSDALFGELCAACDPAFDMGELVRLRGREASMYHREVRLGGRSLSDLFVDARTDPGPLLDALATSRVVQRGRPDDSPLLASLIAPDGPMFRIFSPRDQAVIRRWIASLREGVPASPRPAVGTRTTGACAALVAALGEPARPDPRPSGLRAAYAALQSRAQGPRLREFALAYARDWLDGAARELDGAEVLPPERWSAEGLRQWLTSQHDRHGREFDGTSGQAPPGRAELIDSTVQLAPLTLIDGSWLRGFTDYGYASTDVGYSLFATYWDELGNGVAGLNHPLIYRQVLAEMEVRLPPTGSAEFAAWPGFRDESFELPVYWLCLGSLPRTLLPETLGLNLAMELSGVGGGYRQAAVALRAHGFSTRFVDIHNTIDNVVTGHSAWAVDAICAYLAQVGQLNDSATQRQAWSRVRVGFRSLSPPRRRRRPGALWRGK